MWVPQKQYEAVGEVLAAARKRSGLTQEELAERLAKPQSFISSYERGQRRVDVLELVAIADALRQDPAAVFTEILKAHGGARRRGR